MWVCCCWSLCPCFENSEPPYFQIWMHFYAEIGKKFGFLYFGKKRTEIANNPDQFKIWKLPLRNRRCIKIKDGIRTNNSRNNKFKMKTKRVIAANDKHIRCYKHYSKYILSILHSTITYWVEKRRTLTLLIVVGCQLVSIYHFIFFLLDF